MTPDLGGMNVGPRGGLTSRPELRVAVRLTRALR